MANCRSGPLQRKGERRTGEMCQRTHPESSRQNVTANGTSMPLPPQTIRLSFRHWSPADLETFHAICFNPAVMQFVGDGDTWSRDRTQQWIDQAIEMSQTKGYCLWPLIHRKSSVLIGFCG